MRQTSLVCDWCHVDTDIPEIEDPIEMGWIGVERFDILKGEIVDNDFCSRDCLLAFFND